MQVRKDSTGQMRFKRRPQSGQGCSQMGFADQGLSHPSFTQVYGGNPQGKRSAMLQNELGLFYNDAALGVVKC